MYCTTCGNEVKEGARFCGSCGTPVKAEEDAVESATSETASPSVDDTPTTATPSVDDAPTASTDPVDDVPTAATSPVDDAPTASTAPVDAAAATAADASETMPTSDEPACAPSSEMPKKSNRTKVIVAVVAAVVIIAIAVVCLVMYLQQKEYETTHTPLDVSFKTVASQYVPEGASGTPILLEGDDLDGNHVAEQFLLGTDNETRELLRGTYSVGVAGSPVGGDGVIYSYVAEPITLVIDEKGATIGGVPTIQSPGADEAENADDAQDGDTAAQLPEVSFELTPIAPQDVTDEQIAAIKEWMSSFGFTPEESDAFVILITETRQRELDRIAEEERIRAEEEARARAAALMQAAFGTFPKKFSYSSGAGAWGAVMEIAPDGTFSYDFHDVNAGESGPGHAGTVYMAKFTGKFTVTEQVNDQQFALQLDYLKSAHAAGESIEDNMLNVWMDDATPGFNGPTSSPVGGWKLYMPGTSVSNLNETERTWLQMYLNGKTTLPGMVISDGKNAWIEVS